MSPRQLTFAPEFKHQGSAVFPLCHYTLHTRAVFLLDTLSMRAERVRECFKPIVEEVSRIAALPAVTIEGLGGLAQYAGDGFMSISTRTFCVHVTEVTYDFFSEAAAIFASVPEALQDRPYAFVDATLSYNTDDMRVSVEIIVAPIPTGYRMVSCSEDMSSAMVEELHEQR